MKKKCLNELSIERFNWKSSFNFIYSYAMFRWMNVLIPRISIILFFSPFLFIFATFRRRRRISHIEYFQWNCCAAFNRKESLSLPLFLLFSLNGIIAITRCSSNHLANTRPAWARACVRKVENKIKLCRFPVAHSSKDHSSTSPTLHFDADIMLEMKSIHVCFCCGNNKCLIDFDCINHCSCSLSPVDRSTLSTVLRMRPK